MSHKHGSLCDEDECGSVERAPRCPSGAGHEWTSDGEGGCRENPGVWSLGGTTFQFSAHCIHCSVRRIHIDYGSQRNPDECDTVRYEEVG
jgi:hypothetical protein